MQVRITMDRLAAAPVRWVGPIVQFGMNPPLAFHRVVTRNPVAAAASIRRALDEAKSIRVVVTFWRVGPIPDGSASPRMSRALALFSRRLLDVLWNMLRSNLTPKEADLVRRVLANSKDPECVTYVVGCVLVSSLSLRDVAIQPLPTGVSPSSMLAHPGVWTAILSGDRNTIGARLIGDVAQGRVILYPEVRLNLDEAPILAGRTPLGAPAYIHLGALGRAQHILVTGPTGRGKSVTAMRLVLGAIEKNVIPLVLDTKGEMVREGKGIFGLPVLDPADRNVGWPPWTLPVAHALFPLLREGATRQADGKLVIQKETIESALKQSNSQLLTSANLLTQLLRFVSGGQVDLNPSDFAERYASHLLKNLAWLTLGGSLSLAARMAMQAEFVLREILGEERARQLISPEAPFRHLVVGAESGFGSLLEGKGAVISFRTAASLIGRRGDELLSDLYAFVLSLVVSAILTARESAGYRRRVLLYVEEAHRVRDLIEQMLRLLRAFDISVMLVTQSIEELTPASLEQIRHFLVMGPSANMLEGLFGKLGVPYNPKPFVPAEPYGVGVYISMASGRPAPPQIVRVDLSPEEHGMILGHVGRRVEL